jgi:hypothetical protein
MESERKIHNKCTLYYISKPSKKTLKGDFATSNKGDCPNHVHSHQMGLRAVRWEAGPHERQPKALKNKLSQGGPSGLSPLRSDGSCDGQAGGRNL